MPFSTTDRHILVITGAHSESLSFAKQLLAGLDAIELEDPKKAHTLLGQEFDAVIFNTHTDNNRSFDANAFGAITGTIRGGGYLIILKPEYYPSESLFLKRFSRLLNTNNNIHFINPQQDSLFALPKPEKKEYADIYANTDQKTAVAAISHVILGHRRRPLVITSDRGRGKSAALGIAAKKLHSEGLRNIILCAPSKNSIATVLKHADLADDSTLRFYAPDDLKQALPDADLVLIDEAAAIPLNLLTIFLKRYSRIVFASTQHGYEGSGRGFAINFKKTLNKETPEWRHIELKQAIRWHENDTLEKFSFDALLLNAEPAETELIENTKIADCEFVRLDKPSLIKNEALLQQVFGLLVNAHYQTKPSDLVHLLDDPSVSLYCLKASDQIAAIALLACEGNIDAKLSQQIYHGERRLQGHLVAQALAATVGIEEAPQLVAERILRIAVHSVLQQQGFGKYLIGALLKHSQQSSDIDYMSTSFGVTEALLDFWKSVEFKHVNLGIKRDASSGTHSLIMLYPITKKGTELQTKARLHFSKNYPHLLSDALKDLEPELAAALLVAPPEQKSSDDNRKLLNAFATKLRGYENTQYLIWNLVCEQLPTISAEDSVLTKVEKTVLVAKVLQKHEWKTMVQKTNGAVKGKKEALVVLRSAINKLIYL